MHLSLITDKLCRGGILLSEEAYSRKVQVPLIFSGKVNDFIEPRKSAHEERINWEKARSILKSRGTLISEDHEYSPTRTLFIRLFGNSLDTKLSINLCILLDKLTINTIGKICALFGAGSVLFVFQKKRNKYIS